MDQRRMRSIAKRAMGVSWVTLLGFLVLSHPAHAAVDSEPGALLLQAGGAGFLGGLFAVRKALKRHGRRVPEILARTRDERASLASVPGDAVEQAGS